jgi:AcrR family transcriptional regulator
MAAAEVTRRMNRRTASRARPATPGAKNADRGDREAVILDAAFAEFAARGFAAARLEDIARRAGVAKGLPHFYFGRKEDLFRAVVRRVLVPTWTDLTQSSAAPEGPTRDLLRDTLAKMYERLVDNEKVREVMRLLISEGPRFPELIELYYSEVLAQKIAVWKQLVMRGVERGEFAAGPVLNNPHVIHGPIFMAAIWQLLFSRQRPLDLESWLESHLDLVLNGLERSGKSVAADHSDK